jgi:hypothetical protein
MIAESRDGRCRSDGDSADNNSGLSDGRGNAATGSTGTWAAMTTIVACSLVAGDLVATTWGSGAAWATGRWDFVAWTTSWASWVGEDSDGGGGCAGLGESIRVAT